MTAHFFENNFVKLHYYRFGVGKRFILCFHGFGMHGKQFQSLAKLLEEQYTLIGFDLFFHKQTVLKDQSLATLKAGLTKKQLSQLIVEFCTELKIERFSVLGYSMGTHYATTLVEQLGYRIDDYIVAAPSSLNPGRLVKFLGKNKLGNLILRKLMLSDKAIFNFLKALRRFGIIDEASYQILYKEVATPQLRLSFYACFTYLRFLETDNASLLSSLQQNAIRGIFVFGKRDKTYPLAIGKSFFKQYKPAHIIELDANHELINEEFNQRLVELL